MTVPSTDKLANVNGEDDMVSHSKDQFPDAENSRLYDMLLNHAITLYTRGTSIEEVERFLNDPQNVASFFKTVCNTPTDNNFSSDKGIGESTKNAKEVSENRNEVDGIRTFSDTNGYLVTSEEILTEALESSRLSKFLRFTIYVTLLTAVALVGHIGICHLLEINPLQYYPSLQEKRCLLPAHPILMEMTRPVAECGFCRGQFGKEKGSNSIIIEMKDIPEKTEFAEIAYLSKPIIIRGGGESGGMPTSFNFQNLKEIFESEPGGVDAVSEECQFLPFRSPFTSLREAFEKISENSSWDEPWYIGWSNCHPGVAAKLRELFPRPDFLPDDSSSSAIDWIFIGSPGLGASMHIDYVKRPSWQAQLSGIKRWILHPPPECESVCPESITFTIYPGDLLFLETNTWYHETFIDSDSLSISIGSEYD